MKVIFIEDVKKQAKKDEIKEVKDGYANFLISKKLAVPYTEKSVEVLKKEIKVREDKEEALIEECNQIKKKLEGKEISFKVKTGSQDKVFGSISLLSLEQPLQTDSPKLAFSGKITPTKSPQDNNAPSPIFTTLFGKIIFCSP